MDSSYFLIKYYGQSYFVCPKCRTADTSDWETFRRSHPHLGAYSVSKKSILLTWLAQENVEMSSSGQNYDQNYGQPSFSRQNGDQMSFTRQNSENYGRKRSYFDDEPIRPKILRYSGAAPVGISTVPEVIEIPSSPEVIEIPLSPEVIEIPSSPEVIDIQSTPEVIDDEASEMLYNEVNTSLSEDITSYNMTGGGATADEECPFIETDLHGSHVNLIWDVSRLSMRSIIISDCLKNELFNKMRQIGTCKVQFGLEVEFEKDGQLKSAGFSLNAQRYHEEFIPEGIDRLNEKLANYTEKGSEWKIFRILKIFFKITKYVELMGLSGHSFIPTPPTLAMKKAIVNVQNLHDNLCFLYSILAIKKYDLITMHRYRPEIYSQFLSELVYNEVDMPMKVSNISKFETQNNLSINVFSWDESVPIISSDTEAFKHPSVNLIYRSKKACTESINLMLLYEKDKYHYTAITDLDRLLNCHHIGSDYIGVRSIWCRKCLLGFRYQGAFDRHVTLCEKNLDGTTLYQMPQNKDVKFTDYSKTLTYPFTIYADFESLLVTDSPTTTKHTPASAGMLIVSEEGQSDYKSFVGDDCVFKFLETIETKCNDEFLPYFKNNYFKEMIPLTWVEQQLFYKTKTCYLCKGTFSKMVRDHCHKTGRYIGAACNKCNLARRYTKSLQVPILFHNLRGYDLHHILKYGISSFKKWNLNPIPTTSEKFLSLIVNINKNVTLRFIDSYQFLSESLSTLANLLPVKPLTSSIFDNTIINGKAVFPYDMATSISALESITSMPPKWEDSLSKTIIPDVDYTKACKIWVQYGCRNLLEYMLLYMKLDIYLLADVCQAFRKKAKLDDGLEPFNFFGLPGFAWATAIKGLTHKVELISDPNMYQFFEAGIRGGMTFVNKHHVIATDDTKILYIDINNLYGWALSEKLPHGNFKWILNDDQLSLILKDCEKLVLENLDYGYLCEVDIEIPESIHDFLDDLPVAPEHGCPPGSKVQKLLLTHKKKSNYVIHWRLLQMYLKLGVKVTHIHRAVKFSQACVFADYISKNTKKRAAAMSEFEKNFYKLLNNALYGKTVENLKKRVNLRLCQTEKALITYCSKASFTRSWKIVDDLIAVKLRKELVTLDRPSYIGQAVLDLSKLRMYQLQYVELEKYRKQFGCSIRIVAGDTDSFFLECGGVDLEKQLLPAMIKDSLLDSSNYPTDHPLYNTSIKKVIGKFKDESGGVLDYTEAVFLRPKCYFIESREPIMKAKGVNLKQSGFTLASYLKTYHEGVTMSAEQTRFVSKNHQLYTTRFSKVALSALDNKRRWLEKNRSVAYGHYLDS